MPGKSLLPHLPAVAEVLIGKGYGLTCTFPMDLLVALSEGCSLMETIWETSEDGTVYFKF